MTLYFQEFFYLYIYQAQKYDLFAAGIESDISIWTHYNQLYQNHLELIPNEWEIKNIAMPHQEPGFRAFGFRTRQKLGILQ